MNDRADLGEVEVRTVWWCDRIIERDAYAVQVMRYTLQRDDEDNVTSHTTERLTYDGQWLPIAEGTTIPDYTMEFSGRLIHTLAGATGLVDRANLADALRSLAEQIVAKLIMAEAEPTAQG